jgi:hypothetical protein
MGCACAGRYAHYLSRQAQSKRRLTNRHDPRSHRTLGAASENDTEAYVQAVAKAVGVSPDMEIDLHQYEIMRPTVEAIIRHENGKGPLRTDNTWYNIDVIDEGCAGLVSLSP